jgi:hypothetical protein
MSEKATAPVDPAALETPADVAKSSPKSVFEHPIDVLVDRALTPVEKEDVLKQWEKDEIALQVADDEGMAPGDQGALDDVNKAKSVIDGAA